MDEPEKVDSEAGESLDVEAPLGQTGPSKGAVEGEVADPKIM